ncbi:MAG: FecR domain-containing protein, partial [Aureliella sp.]
MQFRARPKSQDWCRPHRLSSTGRLRLLVGCLLSGLLLPPSLAAQTLGGISVASPTSGYATGIAPSNKVGVDSANQNQLSSTALTARGTVTFRETPLTEVILILAEQWHVNIVAGSQISGQVNGTFKNESLQSILDSILLPNGMQYRQIGNSLVVLPSSDVGNNRSNFRVEVLDVPARDSSEMDELINALRLQMSPDGQLVPITATGKLTLLDTPERIEAVKTLLAQIIPHGATYVSNTRDGNQAGPSQSLLGSNGIGGSPITTRELRPQFILANDLLNPMEMVVLGAGGQVSVVEQENFLVILGDDSVQEKAAILLQQLDKPRPQVRITGYIYDVDLSEMERLGVDWGYKLTSTSVDPYGVPNNLVYSGTGLLTPAAMNQSANTLSSVATGAAGAAGGLGGATGAATLAAAPGGQYFVRTLTSGYELQALIQALEQTKGSRLLADPHVTVVDRHMASLKVVTQVPVQQLTQTQQGGTIGSTAFKDAGIILEVTPRIANDGTIEMEVAPTYSTVSGFSNGNPIIDTRTATSVVRVNHGQALVIGGLRSKTTVETVKGIPGLMNVKYLGALFRVHDTNIRESELLVFIMPEIVGYQGGLDREMQALCVTQHQLSRISTATEGPCTPDCRDKHCPHHYPRPRTHNGMQDDGLVGMQEFGLIGTNDAEFGAAQMVLP